MATSKLARLQLLRGLLAIFGVAALIAGVVVQAPLSIGAGLVALAAAAVGMGRPGLAVGASGVLAVTVLYVCYTGHTPTPFPAVDWVRPRGMDVWPGLLQAGGVLIMLVSAPSVMSGTGRLGLRWFGGIGAVLAMVYWFFPQHFQIDELRAVEAGKATMPVVVDGRVVPMGWGRRGMPATPLEALPELVDNESRLAAIAHGMGHQAGQGQGGGTLRATLWGIQGVASTVVIWSSALCIVVGALVCFGLARRSCIPVWGQRAALGVLLTSVVAPAAVNVLMRVAGLMGGLPEAESDAAICLMQAGGMLGAGLVAWAGGMAAVEVERV